jgi:hypothetical protein
MATIRQGKFPQRSRLSRRRWNTTTTAPTRLRPHRAGTGRRHHRRLDAGPHRGRLTARDPGPARGPPAAPTAPPRRSTCSSRRSSGSATASATSPTTGCACCCTAASPGRLTGPRDCEAAPTLRGVEPVKSARLVVRPCTVHPLRMGLGSATWPMLGECDRGALRRPSWPYARAGHAETSVDRDMRRT